MKITQQSSINWIWNACLPPESVSSHSSALACKSMRAFLGFMGTRAQKNPQRVLCSCRVPTVPLCLCFGNASYKSHSTLGCTPVIEPVIEVFRNVRALDSQNLETVCAVSCSFSESSYVERAAVSFFVALVFVSWVLSMALVCGLALGCDFLGFSDWIRSLLTALLNTQAGVADSSLSCKAVFKSHACELNFHCAH